MTLRLRIAGRGAEQNGRLGGLGRWRSNATTSGLGSWEQRGADLLIRYGLKGPWLLSMVDILLRSSPIWLPSTSSNYGPAVGLSHSGCIHGQPDCTATLVKPGRPVSPPERCLIVVS